MLLVLDVGNSNVVAGVFSGSELKEQVRFATLSVEHSGADELRSLLEKYPIDGAVIGSVVPVVTGQLQELLKRHAIRPLVVNPFLRGTGISFGSVDPGELGADLYANAVAVHAMFRRDCLSVDLGTASTFCVIRESGLYQGTTIVPGMKTSLEALISKAALLSRVPLEAPSSIINTDTKRCLQSGIFYGYSALVDGLIEKIKAEQGNLYVVLTGGIGALLYPYLENVDIYLADLTLQGLRIVYEKVHNQ